MNFKFIQNAFIVVIISALAHSNVANAGLINGSFEDENYNGWTLTANSPSGTWGIAADGSTLSPGDTLFDFFDSLPDVQDSVGLPYTYNATHGSFVATNLQTGPGIYRMYQDFIVGASDSFLSWDMYYMSHEAINSSSQSLTVSLLDINNNLLATLFNTSTGDAVTNLAMTSYGADISAFAGQLVRLDVSANVQNFYFDSVYDNFKVSTTQVPEPSTIAIFALGMMGLSLRRYKNQ